MHDGLVALQTGKGKIGLDRLNRLPEILRQGGWLLAATVIAGGFHYLANVLVGKLLGPEDYGVYTALLALVTVLSAPTGVIQTIIANYTAQLAVDSDKVRQIGVLLNIAQRRLLPWTVGGVLAVALASSLLISFLNIPSPVPVIVVGFYLLPSVLLPITLGALQGLERFGLFGVGQVVVGALRLGLGVGLILLGLGVSGALAGSVLAGLVAFGLGRWWLRDIYREAHTDTSEAFPFGRLLRFSFNVILSTIGLLLLMNGDVLAVKSRFLPLEAGLYSAVVTIGRIALFIPIAVVALMLPKVAGKFSVGQPTIGLVRRSLLAVIVLCGCVVLAFLARPHLIMQWLFGSQFLGEAALLGQYSLAMLLLALVNVWAQYFIAVQETRYAWLLLGGSVIQLAVLFLVPLSLNGVVWWLIVCNAGLVLAGEWLLRYRKSA